MLSRFIAHQSTTSALPSQCLTEVTRAKKFPQRTRCDRHACGTASSDERGAAMRDDRALPGGELISRPHHLPAIQTQATVNTPASPSEAATYHADLVGLTASLSGLLQRVCEHKGRRWPYLPFHRWLRSVLRDQLIQQCLFRAMALVTNLAVIGTHHLLGGSARDR